MSALSRIKRTLNSALAPLRHCIAHESIVPSFARCARAIDVAGLTPATVFDIGVAQGTPWLYEAWPRAQYYLIDPTPQSLPHMKRLSETSLNAKVLNVALGASDGRQVINIRAGNHAGSSFFEEIGKADVVPIPVEVRRFDSLIGEFARPAVAKIDVQGAEIDVLTGLGRRIEEIDVIIVETSLIATIKDGPEIARVVAALHAAGFALYDIVGANRRPLDGALAQIDGVFVPNQSPLRRNRQWSA